MRVKVELCRGDRYTWRFTTSDGRRSVMVATDPSWDRKEAARAKDHLEVDLRLVRKNIRFV